MNTYGSRGETRTRARAGWYPEIGHPEPNRGVRLVTFRGRGIV